MIDKLKQYWWIGTICIMIGGFAYWLNGIEAQASDAKKKADQLENVAKETQELNRKVSQAIVQINEPWFALRNHLILYGVDSAQANRWSQMPLGPPRDSTGSALRDIPYLSKPELPNLGIMMMYKMNGPKIIDTLWNIKED